MKNTGKIIPIAYPDTFVKYSSESVQNKLFPYIGLGKKGYIKAGHALLLLIENATGYIQYFDFGRYVTPPNTGRVRGEKTDAELHIPIQATFSEVGKLTNLEEILLWLAAHPEKTHGEGRMIASVCDDIDYQKALDYIINLQNQGSIPYITFSNTVGSNCSRLVTDTLIAACGIEKVVKKMKRNNRFTPSPLGNVKHASNGDIYKVLKGIIEPYKNSVLLENLTNYFDQKIPYNNTKKLPLTVGNAQLLTGIGASAYFEIQNTDTLSIFKIFRYDENFTLNFEGNFKLQQPGFNFNETYQFVYDSNCAYCHIKQNDVVYRLDRV